MNTYFKNHPDYNYKFGYKDANNKLVADLIERGIIKSNTYNILEIGCGKGTFAYFCNKLGIKNYTGVDIDDYFFKNLKKDFPKYEFIKLNINELVEYKIEKLDIIFTSHLFEHLNKKESDLLINIIYKKLNKNGIWINYMPNADSVFNSTSMRYCDITHQILYNRLSFEQKINHNNVKFTIQHYNDRGSSLIKRLIHIPFKMFFKILYLGMMQQMPQYYTSNLISVLKKED